MRWHPFRATAARWRGTHRLWQRLDSRARLGMWALGLLVTVAVLVPWIAPYPCDHMDLTRALEPPGWEHWLGTDERGGDVLSLLMYGARVALIVGISTVVASAGVGTAAGLVSGYFGGWVDEVLMRSTEILMAFPGILLAILIVFVVQEASLGAVVGALCISGWAGYARLVRGQVLLEREREYVEAARALGFSTWRLVWHHIAPNVFSPVIVQASFGMAGAILAEASLSFLGLGPQHQPSWGALLDQGSSYFLLTPHLAIFPGLAIAGSVLAMHFVGDGLRDHLDPRSATRATFSGRRPSSGAESEGTPPNSANNLEQHRRR